MIINKLFFLLTFSILNGCFSFLNAQNVVTVIPQEYPDGLSSILKGFKPDPGKIMTDAYPTIVREYIKWQIQ